MKLFWSMNASYLLIKNDIRISKLLYEYTPMGKRNVGRERKRWTDQHSGRRKKLGCLLPCCSYWCSSLHLYNPTTQPLFFHVKCVLTDKYVQHCSAGGNYFPAATQLMRIYHYCFFYSEVSLTMCLINWAPLSLLKFKPAYVNPYLHYEYMISLSKRSAVMRVPAIETSMRQPWWCSSSNICSEVDEVLVPLVYDAASPGTSFPAFRDNVVIHLWG